MLKMSDDLTISVIIPHLNQATALETCLDSLKAQTLGAELFEILVVDNGSTVPPTDIIGRYRNARMLYEFKPGPGPARNAGTRAAKGEILAFIDADCRAHPDWLRSIAQALQADQGGIALGGDVRIWRDGDKSLTAIAAYESIFAYRFKLYIERHGFAGTGNLAIRRTDFDVVGSFGGIEIAEDMDWGQRACSAGVQFRYTPDMIVFHPARDSLRELYAKWDRHILHYRNMAEGKRGWKLRWAARALLVLSSPAADIVTVFRSDRVDGFSARIKAFAVLCAIRFHRAMAMLSLLASNRSIDWNRSTGVG